MTSFATHRQRVHDTDRSARARHAALRTCVVSFAPYGFRATYHHLCHSAGIPSDPEADPDSLVRAVEELDAARRLWRADEAAHGERRVREKALGRRAVVPDGGWRDQPGPWLAFCPDPEFHPAEPLPVVVARVLASFVPPGPDAEVCRVCGGAGGTTRWRDGHLVNRLCARCGVRIRADGAEAAPAVAAAREKRWKEIWSAKGGREPGAPPLPELPPRAPPPERPATPRPRCELPKRNRGRRSDQKADKRKKLVHITTDKEKIRAK
ncbi:hypothetical protein [Streptomyces sp. CAU 1734]|uniref:hypothetical protein n=1 Tax=Streptomyces sp. CAU 1734 TaxID=3140360 RepID=UPI00326176EF